MGKWKMKNGKESRCLESRQEMEARKKTELAIGDCIKSDLDRVGEEWEKDRCKESEAADRERKRKKTDNGKGN